MVEAFDYVIVGNSAAGLQALQTLRKHSTHASVAIIDREDHRAYSRVLTPYFVGGKAERDHLFIVDHEFYDRTRVTTLFGRTVVALHTNDKQLELDDGRRVTFGKLLLATGGKAIRLDLPAGAAA